MKTLYETILTELNKIPALKWKDLEAGQLQEEQPPIAYPCALIDVSERRRQNIETKIQRVYATITIDVIVKALGETNSNITEPVRSNSLEYFTIADAVYKQLQGYTDSNFNEFENTSQIPKQTRKGLKVIQLVFETSYNDYTANS